MKNKQLKLGKMKPQKNKNRARKYLTYLIIMSFGLVACEDDFLSLYPETSLSSGLFYKTPTHFDQAILASYEKTRTTVVNGMFMDEMRSDNAFYTQYDADRGPYLYTEVIALFLDDQTTGNSIAALYNDLYTGIGRVNTILSRLETSQLTSEEKSKVRAEALFLRAFFYFDLVLHWGSVPLMLEEVTTEDQAFVANSSINNIYAQIIADVSEAIQIGMPLASVFPQSGRATMGAAKMLRAYAYMTMPNREYALAEIDLLEITQMNYELLASYVDVFDPAKKNHKESIFEIQYLDGDGGQHNDLPWRLIPKCSNNGLLMGVAANNYSNVSGGWCVPTQEMVDSYEAGDKRLDASIAVAEGLLDQSQQFTFQTLKSVVNYKPVTGKGHFYFVKKYYHPPYSHASKTGDNFPVYRYSGALLLLAEALVEQGKLTQALPYINQVRNRAGLDDLTQVTKIDVVNEMRHELAFENHRWTDIIRNGIAIDIMKRHGEDMKKTHGFILPQAFNVTQEKLIYPFHFRELLVNKQLKQNPGY
ncbi:membrane protein [Bacteroidales bacterium]|nr:membrane protein [Bacteroidales bacterium]